MLSFKPYISLFICLFFCIGCTQENTPIQPNFFLINTSPKGIYQNIDFGGEWQGINNGIAENVRLIKQIIRWNGDLICVSFGGGVFKSTDNGKTWIPQNNGLSNDALSAYAITNIGSKLFIATLGGIFISNDNATTWQAKNAGLSGDALLVRTIYADANILFVATADGIYKSEDMAESWSISDVNLKGKAFHKHQGKLWFVSFANGIYASSDNGITWQSQHNGISQIADLQGLSIYGIADKLYYGSMNGLFYSENAGTSWQKLAFNTAGEANHIHSIYQWNRYFMIGTGNGLYYSEDNGKSWTAQSNGLPTDTPIVGFFVE